MSETCSETRGLQFPPNPDYEPMRDAGGGQLQRRGKRMETECSIGD